MRKCRWLKNLLTSMGLLLSAVLLSASLASFAQERRSQPESRREALLQPCLDYGRSFLNTKGGPDPAANAPRFWVESRCFITDPETGESVEYFQAGSCKSEQTFARRDLFGTDGQKNYDFLPIFSDRERLVFRRRAQLQPDGKWPLYREIAPGADRAWGGIEPALRKFPGRVLETPDQIFQAMKAGQLIVGQTEMRDEKTGRTAVIEYPVKTINWRRSDKMWQVDTGPVLLPDLRVSSEHTAQKIVLAYIAFNTFDWADFVVEQPTPVAGEQVYHYSGLVHRLARNVLLALEEHAPNTR